MPKWWLIELGPGMCSRNNSALRVLTVQMWSRTLCPFRTESSYRPKSKLRDSSSTQAWNGRQNRGASGRKWRAAQGTKIYPCRDQRWGNRWCRLGCQLGRQMQHTVWEELPLRPTASQGRMRPLVSWGIQRCVSASPKA